MSDKDLFSSPSPARPADQGDFARGARRAWRVVWRGKYLILACVALVLVPTILYVQQARRLYTAETRIMIQAPETNDVLSERAVIPGPWRLTEEVMQTEVELISSTMLAQRAVAKLNLDKDPEFNARLRPPRPLDQFLRALNPLSWLPATWTSRGDDAARLGPTVRKEMEVARIARAFEAKLTVKPQRRSYIIAIRFSSEDREKAALIANTVAELYVLDRLEASFEEARQVTGWLGDRLKSLQQDALAAESAVERFRSDNDLRRSSDGRATVDDQQLSELNSRLVIARTELAQKQARLQQVRALTRTRGGVDTDSDVLQSQLIQRLREQEASKSRELSEALKTYGDRHPRIVGLRADLADLRSKIATEVDKVATSIANDVEVASAGVASLEREVTDLRQRSNAAGETAVRLHDLERQAEASKSLYETFLSRFKREAEQSHMRRANARVVATAEIPVMPSYPPTAKTIALALFLSLTVAVILVFAIDRLDNTVRSADDAEDLANLPVLAVIPFQRGRTVRPVEAVLERPRSALVDGVRSLRTALMTGEGRELGRTILITSSIPKEGKTFVSLCLATLLAKVDGRVLLIDSDIYRPRLHTALGIDGDCGLAQVLSGEVGADQAIHRGVAGSLDFLPAGRQGQGGDVLQGPQLEVLMRELSKQYSRIIIDSPPVLAVADVRLLARLVDNVVYLLKWGAISRDMARNGLKLLRGAGVPLTGVVLSQVDQRKHAGYGYGDYGQYYGRYSEYYGN